MKKSTRTTVYLVTALMMLTAIIYFIAASQESADASTAEVDEPAAEGGDLSAQVQTIFFAVAGIAYVPAGLWMVKNKPSRRAPYIISIAGSLALIALYVASRTISLPIVGLQEDVGLLDISSKVLQGGIIAGSSYILVSNRSTGN